jgi:hypothetical protein
MPTVPYVSGPRERLAPLPGPRLNPNAPSSAFGGNVSVAPDLSGAIQGVAAIGRERDRIAFEEKAKADQIATTHSYGALVTGVNDMLHGQDGVLNRQGKDAFTIDQDAYDRYGKLTAEIRQALGNDDQRTVFDKQVYNEWSAIDNQVQTHIARERQRYDAQGVDALVKGKFDEAVKNYLDPASVDQSIAVQQAAITDHLKRTGAPDDVVAQQTAQAASTTRLAVLQTLLDDEKDLAATQYFEKYKEQFAGKDYQTALKLTEAGSIRGASQRHADDILKTHHGSLTDALQRTASIDEPRVRDETEQRIRRYFADQAADQRQQRELSFTSLGAKLEQNGGNVDRLKTTAAWLDLTPQDRTALERRATIIRHPDEGPGDDEQFMTLQNEAYFNPETFADRNILGEKDLNAKQKQRLLTLQRSIGAKVHKGPTTTLKNDINAAVGALSTSPGSADALARDDALAATFGGARTAPAPSATSNPQPAPSNPAPNSAAGHIINLEPLPKLPFAPSMRASIIQNWENGGKEYADYLRDSLNVAVPPDIEEQARAVLAKAKAEAKQKAKKP